MPAQKQGSRSKLSFLRSFGKLSMLTKFLIGLSAIIVILLLLAATIFRPAAGPLALLALLAFGVGAGAALRLHVRNLHTVRALAKQVRKMRESDFNNHVSVETEGEIGSLAQEIEALQHEFALRFTDAGKANQRFERLLKEVIPIGVELMTEKDFDGLLERMLRQAQSFCGADGGTLYLKTEDNFLRFEIIHNDTLGVAMGGKSRQKITFSPLPLYDPATGAPNDTLLATYVALTGEIYNFPGKTGSGKFHEQVRQSVIYDSYQIHSMLTIPLKNTNQDVLGVVQLINAHDPETKEAIAFDSYMERWMESFSYLAVAALEAYIREQQLKKEIEHLRLEVDVAKRERQVKEIIETDYFKQISAHAEELRRRKKGE